MNPKLQSFLAWQLVLASMLYPRTPETKDGKANEVVKVLGGFDKLSRTSWHDLKEVEIEFHKLYIDELKKTEA